jgi:2-polyprenyl-6-methoxyphenol hydroxylase-like FAD-dependent oxidoreductase
LLIGDAAHTMTPAVGSGIKYAIEDAVVAANVLSAPLKAGQVRVRDMAEVQWRREWPTRFIQAFGDFFLKQVIGRALLASKLIRVPRFVGPLFRLPLVPKLFAWLIAFGLWQVHVRN